MTSDSKNSQCSAPVPYPAIQGSLGLGTGSGIFLNGNTGDIASEYWRNTLPSYLSVTNTESRSPCGGLTVTATSRRSAGSEIQDGAGGRPFNTILRQAGYTLGLLQSLYNLRMPFHTSAAPSHILIAIGWLCITTCVRPKLPGNY